MISMITKRNKDNQQKIGKKKRKGKPEQKPNITQLKQQTWGKQQKEKQ